MPTEVVMDRLTACLAAITLIGTIGSFVALVLSILNQFKDKQGVSTQEVSTQDERYKPRILEGGNGFEITEDWIKLAPIKGAQYIGLPGDETKDKASPFAMGQFRDKGTSLVLGGTSLSKPLLPPNLPGLILTVGEDFGPSWDTYTGYSAPRPILMPSKAFSSPTGAWLLNPLESFTGMLTPESVDFGGERPQWGFRFLFRTVAAKGNETKAQVLVDLGKYIPEGTVAVSNTGLVCGEASTPTESKRSKVAVLSLNGSILSIGIEPFIKWEKVTYKDIVEIVMTGSVELRSS
jgi:hypothetical protein